MGVGLGVGVGVADSALFRAHGKHPKKLYWPPLSKRWLIKMFSVHCSVARLTGIILPLRFALMAGTRKVVLAAFIEIVANQNMYCYVFVCLLFARAARINNLHVARAARK